MFVSCSAENTENHEEKKRGTDQIFVAHRLQLLSSLFDT